MREKIKRQLKRNPLFRWCYIVHGCKKWPLLKYNVRKYLGVTYILKNIWIAMLDVMLFRAHLVHLKSVHSLHTQCQLFNVDEI